MELEFEYGFDLDEQQRIDNENYQRQYHKKTTKDYSLDVGKDPENIADLISKIGINDFYKAVSETAEYGGLRQADKLIDDKFKNEMKSALDFIKSGKFHQNWKNEASSDYPELKAMRKKLEDSPINEITNKMLKILDQNKSNEI